jgi:hypothetical protein
MEAGVGDAAAFLLERRGDVRGALDIYLRAVDAANAELIEAGKRGRLGMEGAVGKREMVAARSAMQAALAMCLRFSQDHAGDPLPSPSSSLVHSLDLHQQHNGAVEGINKKRRHPAHALWFAVLERYVVTARSLRVEERALQADVPAASRSRLADLQRLFASFIEEVMGCMAGHVPLGEVADAVMTDYKMDSLGDFRVSKGVFVAFAHGTVC